MPQFRLISSIALSLIILAGGTEISSAQVQDVLPSKDDTATKFETDHFSPYAAVVDSTPALTADLILTSTPGAPGTPPRPVICS